MAHPVRKSGFWQNYQNLDSITKGVTIGLATLSLGGLVWFAIDLWGRHRTHHLVLAAGNPTGESYILAKAIEKVVEAQMPQVAIDVQESKGSSENLDRLAQGKADLVTAQADVPAGNKARTVAILYPDSFQLVVQGKSPIQKFTDLKGKRIGLPSKGGQYDSFILVAQHFGLTPQDFVFISENDQAADGAFQQGQVDAIFRVRAIGNLGIATLIKDHGGRLLPIEQADAMRVQYPAFEPTKLPKGAYKGSNPVVPADELTTVSVQRLLLAHERVNPEILRQITQVINENRRELKAAIPENFGNTAPLVANIRRPELTGGTGIPMHPGALAYYDRDEPSFIQKNADYLALILTVALLGGSWLWELKRWVDRRRKDIADNYIEQAIVLMNAPIAPQAVLKELDRLFEQVAAELVREGISQESFRTFNEAYKTVREVIVRKAKNLASQTAVAPVK
jgi:uncharacterized protein